MLLRITQYDEPVLREKGEPVSEFNNELKTLAADMLETMHENEGVGLAAQQVDKALLLFVVDFKMRPKDIDFPVVLDGKPVPMELLMPLTVINGKLEGLGDHVEEDSEGCLSFPGVRGNVERHYQIRLTYQDLEGKPHVIETAGFLARVLQHEYDHTQGILYIDRMTPRSKRAIESKVKKLKRLTRDFLKSLKP